MISGHRNWACPQCNTVRGSSNGCDAHIRQAHTGKALVCSFCSFSGFTAETQEGTQVIILLFCKNVLYINKTVKRNEYLLVVFHVRQVKQIYVNNNINITGLLDVCGTCWTECIFKPLINNVISNPKSSNKEFIRFSHSIYEVLQIKLYKNFELNCTIKV